MGLILDAGPNGDRPGSYGFPVFTSRINRFRALSRPRHIFHGKNFPGNYILLPACGFQFRRGPQKPITSFTIPPDQSGENNYWSKTYGRGSYDYSREILQASDGGFITAGTTGHEKNLWLTKLDWNVEIQWEKILDSGLEEKAYSVIQTGDGGYIAGGFSAVSLTQFSDAYIWVLKLSPGGEIEWQKKYPSYGKGFIKQTIDGGYILTGKTYEAETGLDRFLLLKIDSQGRILWQKSYGNNNSNKLYAFTRTSDEKYILAGHSEYQPAPGGEFQVRPVLLTVDNTGNITRQTKYAITGVISAVAETSDGGLVIGGQEQTWQIYAGTYADEFSNFWIMKLNKDGTESWTKGFSVSGRVASVRQTDDGGYMVAGSIMDESEANSYWLAKLNSDGDAVWQRIYSRTGSSAYLLSGLETTDGCYMLCGYTYSFGSGKRDLWLLKTSADGWSPPFGKEYSSSIANLTISPHAVNFITKPESLNALDWETTALASKARIYQQLSPGSAPPAVETAGALSPVSGEADLTGNVNPGGLDTQVWFEWGNDPEMNSFNVTTTQAAGSGTFSRSINHLLESLSPEAAYYFRMAAANSAGTSRGETKAFTPAATAPVTWARTYGTAALGDGAYYERIMDFRTISDGGFILAGHTERRRPYVDPYVSYDDAWMMKLDAMGRIVWEKTYANLDTDQNIACSVAVSGDGGYVVTGYSEMEVPRGYHGWIMGVDSEGSPLWKKCFCTEVLSRIRYIMPTTEGGYMAVAILRRLPNNSSALLKFTSDGELEWAKEYSIYSDVVRQTADGGYLLTDRGRSNYRTDLDLRVIRLDPDGEIVWQYIYGMAPDPLSSSGWADIGIDGIEAANGDLLIAGYSESFSHQETFPYYFFNIWILRLAGDGSIKWQKTYSHPDPGGETALSILENADGSMLVTGIKEGKSMDHNDILTIKLDAQGNPLWARTYGGCYEEYNAFPIAPTVDGGYLAMGHTLSFGAGYLDPFALKMDSDGRLPPLDREATVVVTDTSVSPVEIVVSPPPVSYEVIDIDFAVDSWRSFIEQAAP